MGNDERCIVIIFWVRKNEKDCCCWKRLHSHVIVSNQLLICVICSDWLAETCCYLLSASQADMLLAIMATDSDFQYTQTCQVIRDP